MLEYTVYAPSFISLSYYVFQILSRKTHTQNRQDSEVLVQIGCFLVQGATVHDKIAVEMGGA